MKAWTHRANHFGEFGGQDLQQTLGLRNIRLDSILTRYFSVDYHGTVPEEVL